MKNIGFMVTDEQYDILYELIHKNKMNGGQFKSFGAICRAAIETFIKNNINSLPKVAEVKEIPADIPTPPAPVESNPFSEINLKF
jgi:hypothetical protein